MKRLTLIVLPYILSVLLLPCGIAAQEIQELDSESAADVLAAVANRQTPWQKVELSGKLKSDLIPVSPSIKIYMENGRRMDFSIRVPFLGEVGRIQADADTIVAINKMKKIYWGASMSELSSRYPGGIELLQSILLGRVALFGEGPVGENMADLISIYPDDEDGWLLMPKDKYQVKGTRYGYVVGPDGEDVSLVIERDNSDDFLQFDYDWKKNSKYDLFLQLAFGSKEIEAAIEFNAPDWNALPMAPIAVDRKYRRVEIKEFLSKPF